MSNRTAKFVSAIFASVLAGANFAAVAENAAKPADSCLSAPKGALPAGSHWYYRVDRATKRHCWYLGEEKDKTAAAAPQDAAASTAAAAPAPPTDLVPPQAKAGVRKSVADAHAELPSPQERVDQDAGVNVQPGNSAAAAVPAIQNSQDAVAPDAGAPPSIVTSRWPDSSGVSSLNNPQVAAADAPANARPAPQPAASPIALAAADSTLQRQSGSTQMLLMVMAGALALAGITASLVFRFARRRVVQPEVWSDRRAIWDSVDTGRSSPSLFPNETVPRWRDNVTRDPRAPDDPERRVQEMLARLAKSAAN
ncbi:hypothetical protein [Bradyrhizobium sp. AZCC 2289]|uniref:hypothetical protein n=1 Tax=Bradyrhizobium sp. AZCC 2289 TaxID=3117026 RepID=UPI002FEEEA3B